MGEKKAIYDELCRVLTDYEGNGAKKRASADDLYKMLVKIQNNWEAVITAYDPADHSALDSEKRGGCHNCNSYKNENALAGSVSKNCKLCGAAMVWENPHIPGHYHASSCNIDDWPICHECMVEHCFQTNCLGCEYGKHPECRFLEMKRHYMSEDETEAHSTENRGEETLRA